MKQNYLRLTGLLAVIVLIIVAFVAFVDMAAVLVQLRAADLGLLGAASAALLLGLLAYAVRWRLLLDNKPHLPFTFHASNMGHAGNILIPFRGGEAVRVVVMGRSERVSLTEATSSFVVERLFEQLLRMLALVGAVVVGAGLELSPATVLGGVGVLLGGFGLIAWLVSHQEATINRGTALLSRLPRLSEAGVRASLTDLLGNLNSIARPPRFLLVLLWSLVTWFFFWAFFYLTLLALPAELAGEALPISLGALALSPPSAPTQPGIFHASIVLPLAAVGFDRSLLTAYTILLHVLEMFWMIGFGLLGLLLTGLSARALLQPPEAGS